MFYFQTKKQQKDSSSSYINTNLLKKQSQKCFKQHRNTSAVMDKNQFRIFMKQKQKIKIPILPQNKQKPVIQKSLQQTINGFLVKNTSQYASVSNQDRYKHNNILLRLDKINQANINYGKNVQQKQKQPANKKKSIKNTPFSLYQLTQPIKQLSSNTANIKKCQYQFIKNVKQVRNKDRKKQKSIYNYKTVNVYDKVSSHIENNEQSNSKNKYITSLIEKYKDKKIQYLNKNAQLIQKVRHYRKTVPKCQNYQQQTSIIQKSTQKQKKKQLFEDNNACNRLRLEKLIKNEQVKKQYQQFSPWRTEEQLCKPDLKMQA